MQKCCKKHGIKRVGTTTVGWVKFLLLFRQ